MSAQLSHWDVPTPWEYDHFPHSNIPQSHASIYAADSTFICNVKGSKSEAIAKLICESVNEKLSRD